MADSVPPTPTPGPKRIRSLPDRPVRLRTDGGGGVRSLPDRAPASTRLPGTDAASYGGDMSWRRGVAVLWTLFGLIAVIEAFVLAVYLLGGGKHRPDLLDIIRLTILCAVFLALWFGWGWTRWVLAVVAFCAGGRTALLILLINNHGVNADYLTSSELLGTLVFDGMLAVLAALYLILCAYLIFSADVFAFTQHRRQEGRGWVVVPVGLLLGVYWAAMLGSNFALRCWLESTRPDVLRQTQNDVQAMAADWDPASLTTVLDADALKNWPPESRAMFMQAVRPLGTYLGPGDEDTQVYLFFDPAAGKLCVRGECHETVRCTNGRATFDFLMTRPLTGSWRVEQLAVGGFQFYKPPAPEPSPTPAATASPAAIPIPSAGG